MQQRKRKGNVRPQLVAVNLHAAGIDIGAQEHGVAVPPDRAPQPLRRLGACTADLEALAAWLQQCGVTTVAMESPGVDWILLFELPEARGSYDPTPAPMFTMLTAWPSSALRAVAILGSGRR